MAAKQIKITNRRLSCERECIYVCRCVRMLLCHAVAVVANLVKEFISFPSRSRCVLPNRVPSGSE